MTSTSLPPRTAYLERSTKETSICCALSLDGGPLTHGGLIPSTSPLGTLLIPNSTDRYHPHHAEQYSTSQSLYINTGIGFLDHMLHALAKHSGWSLHLYCNGDLSIDDHHTAEDVALLLGLTFRQALTTLAGLTRFSHAYAPLDEALSRAVVDLSNRPSAHISLPFTREKIGQLSTEMIPHVFESFAQEARITLHVDCIKGTNNHHIAESAFKATALALRGACKRTQGGEVMSTKGVL